MRQMLVVACALAVGGCGVARDITLRDEYQKSVADYRACLDANSKDPHACDSKRLSMEAQEREYNNLALSKQGGNSTANINVQSR